MPASPKTSDRFCAAVPLRDMGTRIPLLLPAALVLSLVAPTAAKASECDTPSATWLTCEDFESGDAGFASWYSASPFVECKGCSGGENNPERLQLDGDPTNAHDGDWSMYLPAGEAASYQGAELSYRTCDGAKQSGCTLTGHDRLYFRTWVRLAEDNEYVHHFLSLRGTKPNDYWDADGNAGCRPNGDRHIGTTLDFNRDHELFFYTYTPDMNCDAGGYCSGDFAQDICNGCASRDLPCENGLECCWGNAYRPEPAVVLPTGEWACLEMMMEVNTPGQSDGSMAFWLNDQLGHEVNGMNVRDTAELQLNYANLGNYIDVGHDQSNRLWWDDMVVSTERIGCSATIPPDTDTDAGSASGPGGDTDGDSAGSGTSGNSDTSNSSDGSLTTGNSQGGQSSAGPGGSGSSSDPDAQGDTEGCGCQANGRAGDSGWLWVFLATGLFVRRRRRSVVV